MKSQISEAAKLRYIERMLIALLGGGMFCFLVSFLNNRPN